METIRPPRIIAAECLDPMQLFSASGINRFTTRAKIVMLFFSFFSSINLKFFVMGRTVKKDRTLNVVACVLDHCSAYDSTAVLHDYCTRTIHETSVLFLSCTGSVGCLGSIGSVRCVWCLIFLRRAGLWRRNEPSQPFQEHYDFAFIVFVDDLLQTFVFMIGRGDWNEGKLAGMWITHVHVRRLHVWMFVHVSKIKVLNALLLLILKFASFFLFWVGHIMFFFLQRRQSFFDLIDGLLHFSRDF